MSSRRIHIRFRAVAGLALLAGLALPAFAEDAQIVLLQGQGEKSGAAAPSGWTPAVQGDPVPGGFWVRTLANSQMGLMVPSRNQIRLNQNSLLQVKTAAESAKFTQARVSLAKGRAWSQARPRPPGKPGAAAGAAPALAMETPSATMSIRGTDWEVEVGDDGKTQLVVLSGNVDIANEFGEVNVAKGEAAIAEVGKAPVKFVLINPESRVQWVSSWKPQPARWAGADAARYGSEIALIDAGSYDQALASLQPRAGTDAGAAVLAADLLVQRGDLQQAVDMLSPHAANGSGDARAVAVLARAWSRLDKTDDAARLLDAGMAAHPDDVELLLARGELAVLDGDAEVATGHFRRVVERDPKNAEGWYGLGLIASEREYVRAARRDLGKALEVEPGMQKAGAELASVDTFANNLASAEAQYAALIEKEPGNYEALTGRGINRLKRGNADAALEDFLRAGLVEPRYARAWLYSGVAFYQKGERERALQAFQHAEDLDKRDPIPHMMASQVAADELDFGKAVAEARVAQQKMPYLKSLNQLANDQKGSANLGSPIANFGMEEWALYYANEAYSPYWGGSHLFRSDRYTGAFTKNSELMKGFITDPLAFGASNRHSSLAQEPGNYGRIDAEYRRDDYEEGNLVATANGLAMAPIPVAYFLRAERGEAEARRSDTKGDADRYAAGIGMRPFERLSIFAFGSENLLDSKIRETELPDDDLDQHDVRGDIGVNFKIDPDNQLWLKTGNGYARNRVDGTLYSTAIASTIEGAYPSEIVQPNRTFLLDWTIDPAGTLDENRTEIDGDDWAFRHAFNAGGLRVSWGAETSDQHQTLDFISGFNGTMVLSIAGTPIVLPPSSSTSVLQFFEDFRVTNDDYYVSLTSPVGEVLEVQADLYYQTGHAERSNLNYLLLDDQLLGSSTNTLADQYGKDHFSDLNPRIGLKWQIADGRTLRAVWQSWRRSGAFNSLANVDTSGIVLNDRITAAGADYERARLQFDGEFANGAFLQAFIDHEEVDNGLAGQRTSLFSFQVRDLEKLRQREEFYNAYDEIEETPVFDRGSVDTFGLAGNMIVAQNVSLFARYLYRDAEQDGALDGNDIPFLSKDYLRVGLQWDLPGRWMVGTHAVYRGKRYEDDRNITEVDAGWSFGLKAYWETADKHHTVQAIIDNLAGDDDAMVTNRKDPLYRLVYSFKF